VYRQEILYLNFSVWGASKELGYGNTFGGAQEMPNGMVPHIRALILMNMMAENTDTEIEKSNC